MPYRPLLPTPKGKLLLIIESLKRASTNQRPPIEHSTSVDNTVCSRETDAVDKVCYHKTGWADKKSKCIDHLPPQSAQPQSSSEPNQIVQPSQAPSVSIPMPPLQTCLATSASYTPSTFSPHLKAASTEPSQTSTAVPPPPPPPPPAMPSLEATVTRYCPSVPLKPLFWRRVQFSSAQLRRVDNVWKHISEPG